MLKTVLNWFGISNATISDHTFSGDPPPVVEEAKPKKVRPNNRTARCWLEARPDVKVQVDAAARRQPVKYARIHKWLIDEHGFPYSDESLRRYVHHVVFGKSLEEVYDMAKLPHIKRKRV